MKVGVEDLEDLSTGAVLLATGGGGDPYDSFLCTRQVLAQHGPVPLIPVDALADDAYVAAIGSVGAPSVGLELLPSVDDAGKALRAFEAHVGRKLDAVVSFEVGGGNSMIPLMAAAEAGIGVVDGDGMGRALPEAQMMTFPIGGVGPTPALAMDYAGNSVTFDTDSTTTYERHIRSIAQAMGGMITAVEHPMLGHQLKTAIIPNSISFSIRLGRILREQRGTSQRTFAPLSAAFADSLYGDLHHLYSGKVVDYSSAVVGGYDVGQAIIQNFDERLTPLTINIKNEYLVARRDQQLLAMVPDLIMVIDMETSTPINAERLRYGQRVSVLAVGCPDFYRTPRALAVVAPSCFGFDLEFTPVEHLVENHVPLND